VGNFIMKKFVRLAALAAVATAVATPALAQQVPVTADPKAKAHARILKPLVLRGTQDVLFGDIVVGTVAGSQTVTVDHATGILSGCTNGLTCSGTVQNGEYEVEGSNGATVLIDSTDSDLQNAAGDILVFTPNHPVSVVLANSGSPGTPFNVGGSITLDTNTPEGLYEGDMEITVQYP
jgi:hypothetical protein